MNSVLQKFCTKLASLGFSVFAQDKAPAKDGWITVRRVSTHQQKYKKQGWVHENAKRA